MKDTRSIILQTAIALFKEKGYENTSVIDICDKCGITKGTFYYHFANKDELTFEFYEQLFSNYPDLMSELLMIENPKEQLWRVMEFSIDSTIELTPQVLKALMISDIQNGLEFFSPFKTSHASSLRESQYKMQIQLISKGQRTGDIKPGDPDLMLTTFIAALIGIAIDWSSNDGYYDEKEALRKAFDIIF